MAFSNKFQDKQQLREQNQMAKIVPVDIPLNLQPLAQELLKTSSIIKLVKDVEQYGFNPDIEMELTYEATGNGYTLFYIRCLDHWAINTPNGEWLQAAIGYDDSFIQGVLEPENYIEVLRAHINSLDKIHSVFILRNLS